MLSIAISLFWLVFAVMIHLGLELIRQQSKKQGAQTIILESLWETKVDFALVAFALCLAVYLDFIFGVAGLGAAARVGVQTGSRAGRVGGRLARLTSRFAAWQRIIRNILISLDDVLNAARFIQKARRARKNRKPNKSPAEELTISTTDPHPTRSSWVQKWSAGDYIGGLLFVLFVLLVVLAPWIIDMPYSEVLSVIKTEFHPFP